MAKPAESYLEHRGGAIWPILSLKRRMRSLLPIIFLVSVLIAAGAENADQIVARMMETSQFTTSKLRDYTSVRQYSLETGG